MVMLDKSILTRIFIKSREKKTFITEWKLEGKNIYSNIFAPGRSSQLRVSKNAQIKALPFYQEELPKRCYSYEMLKLTDKIWIPLL